LGAVVAIWSWRKPKDKKKKELRPSFLVPWQRALLAVGLVVVAAVASLNGLMYALDYSILYLVIAGSLILIRKKTEAWGLYLAADIAGVPLFLLSGSYMMLFTLMFFMANNVAGLYQWQREKK
jgi:nicotinamide mononucleotide transporter PnuC